MRKCKVDECAWNHEGYCSEEEDYGKGCTCKSNDELLTEEEWEQMQKEAWEKKQKEAKRVTNKPEGGA